MAVEERKAIKQKKTKEVKSFVNSTESAEPFTDKPDPAEYNAQPEKKKIARSEKSQPALQNNQVKERQELDSSGGEQNVNNDFLADEQRRELIAREAYYNAERRGFQSGFELDDWLAAERQIGGHSVDHSVPSARDALNESELPINNNDVRAGDQEIIEPNEVTKWAKNLGVSAPTLREAINRIGSRVDDVRDLLKDQTKH